MLTTLLQVLHVFVCAVLMFVVLLQQGKGGGMGAALGGGGAAQVFGGRGAGNILTRATAIAAATFMVTSVSLAYISSTGDRALKARATAEEKRHASKGTPPSNAKSSAPPAPAAPSAAPPSGGAAAPDEPSAPPASTPSPSP
jgi:preprotein translocase subunit SecG